MTFIRCGQSCIPSNLRLRKANQLNFLNKLNFSKEKIMTTTKLQIKISATAILAGVTLTILSAVTFPANASPVTLTGDKGTYTIDREAGTYKGCLKECISLGPQHRVGEFTWVNGEYKYVVGEEGVFVYKNQTLIFSDRLHIQ
jgi:predicted lipoprotein with Yx(FWY)xxD motif